MGQYLTLPKEMATKMIYSEKIQVNTPDINEWHPFISGYGINMNPEIDDMIKTTNRLELWEWFRDSPPPKDKGYSWWKHENIDAISKGLENNNHSGSSFSMCMQQMQFIAENSWEKWNERNARWNAEHEAKKALARKMNQMDPGAHLVDKPN